jgi:hypothetical protein
MICGNITNNGADTTNTGKRQLYLTTKSAVFLMVDGWWKMYNGSAQSVGKMRGSTPHFATTIFRYSFKNLVNKAVGPGGWSVIKWIKEIFKRVLSPARDGYATVLELLGSADRCKRAGIFSHNQSVASQFFLWKICIYHIYYVYLCPKLRIWKQL